MKDLFITTASEFTEDPKLIENLWQELLRLYGQKKRHYHNLEHLKHLFQEIEQHKNRIEDWAAMVFAVFYHDAVYQVLKSDNEEKSAALAEKRLRQMNFPEIRIALCTKHILATKSHHWSEPGDTNWLLDADLSILGTDWNQYLAYSKQVRKEYGIFPDLVYKPGRKKVLTRFLESANIYKTPEYRARFEMQARENIQQEIQMLS